MVTIRNLKDELTMDNVVEDRSSELKDRGRAYSECAAQRDKT